MKQNVLKAFSEAGLPDAYIQALTVDFEWFEKFGIDTTNRWAHFIAQCGHESGSFSRFEENLNYRAHTLMRVWPHRFPTLSAAKQYGVVSGMSKDDRTARNTKLANKVYGGRMGNDHPNDGYRYRGRGPIQLTGSNNYAAAGAYMGLDLIGDPDIVTADPFIGLAVAAWFFCTRTYKGKTCAEWADANSVAYVTRAINGGKHGLADRKSRTDKATAWLNASAPKAVYVPPRPRHTIRVGSRSTDVKYLQRMLIDMGYARFSVTNYFGPKTVKAIKAFQTANGLTPDAIVGPVTWGVLQLRYELHRELTV